MSQQEQNIRRILVALDSSPASQSALEQAVALAANLEAELVGLYVEDINLVRLAEISISHEVGLFSATSRRLEVRYVERQFRGQASRVGQALASLADRAGVEWAFRVVRGVVSKELLRAAAEADLIILGRLGLSVYGRKRLGSTARAILQQAPRLALILQPGGRLGLPILVLYDGSTVARKALGAAAQLAQQIENGPLTVLIIAEEPQDAHQYQQEVERRLEEWSLTARYVWQHATDRGNLMHTVQAEECRMLVTPGDGSVIDRESILALLERIECPVLLVR